MECPYCSSRVDAISYHDFKKLIEKHPQLIEAVLRKRNHDKEMAFGLSTFHVYREESSHRDSFVPPSFTRETAFRSGGESMISSGTRYGTSGSLTSSGHLRQT